MADNEYKRAIANRALSILVAGVKGDSGILFKEITDAEFADYTTVSEQNEPDKRLICALYESVLKQVIEDIAPQFARRYADLGQAMAVNSEYGGWSYLFELPSDYLALIKQLSEGSLKGDFKCEILMFHSYSHVVCGTDYQAYYCNTEHTSADDSSDGQPPDNDGNSNWTLYSTDGGLGADWAASVLYKNEATGKLLATNSLTNDNGNSAYIQYLGYALTAFGDMPQYYPENFKNAFATRLAAEIALNSKDYKRRTELLTEYKQLARGDYIRVQQRHAGGKKHITVFEARTR